MIGHKWTNRPDSYGGGKKCERCGMGLKTTYKPGTPINSSFYVCPPKLGYAFGERRDGAVFTYVEDKRLIPSCEEWRMRMALK